MDEDEVIDPGEPIPLVTTSLRKFEPPQYEDFSTNPGYECWMGVAGRNRTVVDGIDLMVAWIRSGRPLPDVPTEESFKAFICHPNFEVRSSLRVGNSHCEITGHRGDEVCLVGQGWVKIADCR